MGTQGAAGRKRASAKDYTFSAEDDALHKISVEAEARLATKRAARAEAREIRLRELERQKRREYRREWESKSGDVNRWVDDAEKHHRRQRRQQQVRVAAAADDDDADQFNVRGQIRRFIIETKRTFPSIHVCRIRSEACLALARVGRAAHADARAALCPRAQGSQDSSDGRSVADFFGSASRRSSVSSAVSDFDINGAAVFGGDIGRVRARGASEGGLREHRRHLRGHRLLSFSPAPPISTVGSVRAASSRRGSGDTAYSVGTDSSIQELRDIFELKDELHGVEERYMQKLKELKKATDGAQEKYKKAMVSNAQLDNEKAALSHEVEVLREALEDAEEQSAEARRELSDARSDAERQRQAGASAQHKLQEARDALRQREEHVQEIPSLQRKEDALAREVFDLRETVNWKEKKITALERQKEYYECIRAERDELRAEVALLREKTKKLSLGVAVNGDEFDAARDSGMLDHVAPTAAEAAVLGESSSLPFRLKRLTEENDALLDELRRASQQLEEERRCRARVEVAFARPSPSELEDDFYLRDFQRETNKHLSEYKYKLAKSEQEKDTLEKNILRLQGHISRHKAAADGAEKEQDEIKADRRRLQRELHLALEKLDEMETTNNHLMMRLSKLKAKRDVAYAQQPLVRFHVARRAPTRKRWCIQALRRTVSRAMRPPWDLLLLLVSALLGALLGCMAEQQVLVKRVQEGGTVVLNCTEASDVNHWFWLPDFQECAEGKPASEQFDGRIEMTSNPNCELVLSNLTARDAGKLIVPESMHRNVELVITPDCTGLHIEASPHGPFVASTSVNLTCRLPRHASSAPPVRWTFFTLGKGADEQHGEVVTASMEGLWTCTVGDRDTHFCLSKSSSSTMNGWWCNETKLLMSEVGRSSESSLWTISSLPMPLLIAVCVGAALLPLLLLSAITYACFMRSGTEIEIELQDYENISKSETVSGNAEAQPRRNEDVYFNDDLYGEVE
ncbi:unnamed protein product [Lampetra fluviatilis]